MAGGRATRPPQIMNGRGEGHPPPQIIHILCMVATGQGNSRSGNFETSQKLNFKVWDFSIGQENFDVMDMHVTHAFGAKFFIGNE